jgi:hypothetical protein
MKTPLVPATLALCASYAVGLASPLVATAADLSNELDWNGGIAAGSTLTVVDPHGDIFVQRSDDKGISVRALVRSGDASRVALKPTANGRDLTLCTALPDVPASCDTSAGRASARDVAAASAYKVDELILVPAGVRVVVRGTVGKIVVEDTPGADATTIDGDVHVSLVKTVSQV